MDCVPKMVNVHAVAGGAAKIAKSRPDVQGRRFHAVVGESVFLVAHAGVRPVLLAPTALQTL